MCQNYAECLRLVKGKQKQNTAGYIPSGFLPGLLVCSPTPISPYIRPFMTNSFIYFRFLLKGHFLNEKLLNNHICLHRSKAPSSWTDSLTSLQFSLRCCAVCVHWLGFRPFSNLLLSFLSCPFVGKNKKSVNEILIHITRHHIFIGPNYQWI